MPFHAFVDGSIGSIAFPTDASGDLTTATVNGLPGGVQATSTITIATQEQPGDCYFQIQALTGS